MKHLSPLRLALVFVTALLHGIQAQNTTGSCCKFTISSPSGFPSPAGQLDDGQIRFNGTYPPASFCLGNDGGITDAQGKGCIVTGKLNILPQAPDIQKPLTRRTMSQVHPPHRSNAISTRHPQPASPSAPITLCPIRVTRNFTLVPPRTLSTTYTSRPTLISPNVSPSPWWPAMVAAQHLPRRAPRQLSRFGRESG